MGRKCQERKGIDFRTFYDYCAAMKEIKFFYIPPLAALE